MSGGAGDDQHVDDGGDEGVLLHKGDMVVHHGVGV